MSSSDKRVQHRRERERASQAKRRHLTMLAQGAKDAGAGESTKSPRKRDRVSSLARRLWTPFLGMTLERNTHQGQRSTPHDRNTRQQSSMPLQLQVPDEIFEGAQSWADDNVRDGHHDFNAMEIDETHHDAHQMEIDNINHDAYAMAIDYTPSLAFTSLQHPINSIHIADHGDVCLAGRDVHVHRHYHSYFGYLHPSTSSESLGEDGDASGHEDILLAPEQRQLFGPSLEGPNLGGLPAGIPAALPTSTIGLFQGSSGNASALNNSTVNAANRDIQNTGDSYIHPPHAPHAGQGLFSLLQPLQQTLSTPSSVLSTLTRLLPRTAITVGSPQERATHTTMPSNPLATAHPDLIVCDVQTAENVLAESGDVETVSCHAVIPCHEGPTSAAEERLGQPPTVVTRLDNVGARLRGVLGFVAWLRRTLQKAPVQVNLANGAGQTPLMLASQNGQTGIVNLLLTDSHIDVNLSDRSGRTALILGSSYGHQDVVQLLLDHPGIEVNRKAANGRSALFFASLHGHEEIVKLLLEMPAIHVGSDMFFAASARGHLGTARLLETRLVVNSVKYIKEL
ncbi:hypothetical protein BKA70DRAFT_1301103 [Coprinopsis sp. MPI-PUGE-AT-0042]|nr:hypothetical protein BKA70DRAFT_1301103 [Coprinopsis sp. MPI-PUGE-AT-0042]